jgi:uncharacterized protein (TIGR02271 family)
MSQPDDETHKIPLVEERATIEKNTVETGRVRIRTVVGEQLARVSQDVAYDDVSIEHVAVNRQVSQPPPIREENGVLIIPILEEVLVVEKRLVLKEELHVRKNRKHERAVQSVRLRKMRAEVQRVGPRATPEEVEGKDAGLLSRQGVGEVRTAGLHRKDPVRRLRK